MLDSNARLKCKNASLIFGASIVGQRTNQQQDKKSYLKKGKIKKIKYNMLEEELIPCLAGELASWLYYLYFYF